MPILPIETRIQYYKEDIERWKHIDDPSFKVMVKQLRKAVTVLQKELKQSQAIKPCFAPRFKKFEP